MAQFYTTCQGGRGQASRLGHKNTGASTQAAGHNGCIEVIVWYNKEKDRDEFRVLLKPWGGSGGATKEIASGILDSSIDDPFIPALIA